MATTSVIESLEGVMDYIRWLERKIGNLNEMLSKAEAEACTAQPHACYREGYVDASRQFQEIAGRIGGSWEARVNPGKSARPKKPSAELLSRSIDTLDLPTRITNQMHARGIDTLGNLIGCNEQDLLDLRNIGNLSIQKVKVELGKLGLSLRKDS